MTVMPADRTSALCSGSLARMIVSHLAYASRRRCFSSSCSFLSCSCSRLYRSAS